ncbi:hypothetical protein PV10_01574 [Exophiala mesophila]|uniref:Uncharacterized protein n=1 Tax=Exophiala mesophila TaxID=212818 RepID=A0A0D2AG21_EXOME|nr:uncharacterized protein PV10_01574 [Exophiala mesophila]KIV97873.1 hypothetical protein PV10_01574 [Exophiala mesophila]
MSALRIGRPLGSPLGSPPPYSAAPDMPTTSTSMPKTTVEQDVVVLEDGYIAIQTTIKTRHTTITTGLIVGRYHLIVSITTESTAIMLTVPPIEHNLDCPEDKRVYSTMYVDHDIQPFFQQATW